MSSQARQNFHEDCEAAINRQINLELYASYVYLSMVIFFFENAFLRRKLCNFFIPVLKAYYFDRDDVALPGMHWYFKHSSDEEREHAMKLLKYLNKRGGRIVLQDIKNPETPCEYTAAEAMEKALELEKKVNEVGQVENFNYFTFILFIVLALVGSSWYRLESQGCQYVRFFGK